MLCSRIQQQLRNNNGVVVVADMCNAAGEIGCPERHAHAEREEREIEFVHDGVMWF